MSSRTGTSCFFPPISLLLESNLMALLYMANFILISRVTTERNNCRWWKKDNFLWHWNFTPSKCAQKERKINKYVNVFELCNSKKCSFAYEIISSIFGMWIGAIYHPKGNSFLCFRKHELDQRCVLCNQLWSRKHTPTEQRVCEPKKQRVFVLKCVWPGQPGAPRGLTCVRASHILACQNTLSFYRN